MNAARARRISLNLTDDIVRLANNAITGSRYGSVSAYVRALIVSERRQSGDKAALRVSPEIKMGRPKAA
jgi:Arc/MetJ-type ribon-helix-helix transcriptional regulator